MTEVQRYSMLMVKTEDGWGRDITVPTMKESPNGIFVDYRDFDRVAAELERFKSALKFYAERDHFSEDIGSDWDSVSGEPSNILWHEDESWFVEDGSIARAALENKA